MRISILQGAFLPLPPLLGGAVEKMWLELGKQFSLQGHSVCSISRSFPGLPDQEVIEGVLHVRFKGYEFPANILKVKWLDLLYTIRAFQHLPPADILITNTFFMPILAGWRQSRHGMIIVDVARMPKGQMPLYGKAACLRANSSSVQKAIANQAPWLASRIRTIPNPLPFQPQVLLTAEREPVVLYCGRLHPEKGIQLLIQAFTIACAQGLSGWSLRLVGPADTASGGGGLGWLNSLLSAPEVSGIPIEWLGPIYDQQLLISQYEQAAIFVYPSLAEKGETFGLAPLEAMACGAVPIVSGLTCFRDFITPGLNGMVFNHRASDAPALLATQILGLINNPDQRTAMSQAALAVRQSHHPAKIAKEFLRCFDELIKQSSKPKQPVNHNHTY